MSQFNCCCLKNIVFLITTIVISFISYSFVASHITNTTKIKNLQNDINLMAIEFSKLTKNSIFLIEHINNRGNELIVQKTDRILNELEIIIESLKYFNKNKRADFALASLGAVVVSTHNTDLIKTTSIAGLINFVGNPPQLLLEPSMYPGECFGFHGDSATITIKLTGNVFLDAVAIEHIEKSLSPTGNIFSAPKDFNIWALKTAHDYTPQFLGEFTYDINNKPLQIFDFPKTAESYGFLKIQFTSNNGNSQTCVYKVSVHGTLEEND